MNVYQFIFYIQYQKLITHIQTYKFHEQRKNLHSGIQSNHPLQELYFKNSVICFIDIYYIAKCIVNTSVAVKFDLILFSCCNFGK